MALVFLGFVVGVFNEAPAFYRKEKRIFQQFIDIQAATLNIFSFIGAAMAGRIADRIGRRKTVTLTGFFLFFGTLFIAFAHTNVLFLSGRAIAQVGIGLSLTVAPVYIAEMSPATSRGLLASFPEVFINMGTLLAHVCRYFIPKFKLQRKWWNFMGGLGLISSVLLTIGAYFIPESPRWLVMQGRQREARDVLVKITNSDAETECLLNEIRTTVHIPEGSNQANVRSTGEGVCWEFLSPTPFVWHALVCALGVNIIQQACGVDTILLYSSQIYKMVGMTSANASLLLLILMQLSKTLPSLIVIFCLDMTGRRRLLLISLGGAAVSLAVLGSCLTGIDRGDTKPKWAVTLCLPSLISYVVSFAIGLGPIASVYTAEVFPVRLRAQGQAIGVAANQGMSLLLTSLFIISYQVVTPGGFVFIFMVMSSLGFIFVYLIMPETKGESLEKTWQLFGEFLAWRFRSTGTETADRAIELTQEASGSEASPTHGE